jgi:hypothetical protein
MKNSQLKDLRSIQLTVCPNNVSPRPPPSRPAGSPRALVGRPSESRRRRTGCTVWNRQTGVQFVASITLPELRLQVGNQPVEPTKPGRTLMHYERLRATTNPIRPSPPNCTHVGGILAPSEFAAPPAFSNAAMRYASADTRCNSSAWVARIHRHRRPPALFPRHPVKDDCLPPCGAERVDAVDVDHELRCADAARANQKSVAGI